MTLPLIAVTMGDPAGIGPEVTLKAIADAAVLKVCQPVVVGHRGVLTTIAAKLGLVLPALIEDPTGEPEHDLPTPGRIDVRAGLMAGRCIDHAIAGCREGRFAALVTAPINKAAMHLAGYPFPGHTEWLAARCGVSGETMMMYHRRLAVALVTCHQSLISVPASLTTERIHHVGRQLHEALRRLRRRAPRLALLGFNPHASEAGLFGDEEARVIEPAAARLRADGVAVDGPLPPDTAFTPRARKRYDGWICMYHDQALLPFKALAFDDGVNVTLGLPIVRTSVDHGTAFDLAWQGTASHQSQIEAIRLAARLAGNRQRR